MSNQSGANPAGCLILIAIAFFLLVALGPRKKEPPSPNPAVEWIGTVEGAELYRVDGQVVAVPVHPKRE